MVARKNKPANVLADYPLFAAELDKFDTLMKDAVAREPGRLERRCELAWPIHRLVHQRARYMDECVRVGLVPEPVVRALLASQARLAPERQLLAQWRRTGYETLCCLGCIQAGETNFGAACVCRVPRRTLEEADAGSAGRREVECVTCGCRGCASSD